MTDYDNGHQCGFEDEGRGLVKFASFDGCSREFVRGYFAGVDERCAVEESWALERLAELQEHADEVGAEREGVAAA